MGKPAATDRRRLKSLSHSFTLDFVIACNGTKAQALTMKEEIKNILGKMGLTLSEEKTKITHITEGFKFLGYWIEKSIGGRGKMAIKVSVPQNAIRRFRAKLREITSPRTHHESANAKILAINSLIRGWCQYYQSTTAPGK